MLKHTRNRSTDKDNGLLWSPQVAKDDHGSSGGQGASQDQWRTSDTRRGATNLVFDQRQLLAQPHWMETCVDHFLSF